MTPALSTIRAPLGRFAESHAPAVLAAEAALALRIGPDTATIPVHVVRLGSGR